MMKYVVMGNAAIDIFEFVDAENEEQAKEIVLNEISKKIPNLENIRVIAILEK